MRTLETLVAKRAMRGRDEGGRRNGSSAVVLLTVLEGKLCLLTDTTWMQLVPVAELLGLQCMPHTMLTHHAQTSTPHHAHPFSTLPHLQLLTQLSDLKTVIPRNSVIEANQSGLIAEPLLDVTPQLPLPQWSVGPNHPDCDQEGAIVCENGRCVGGVGLGIMLL